MTLFYRSLLFPAMIVLVILIAALCITAVVQAQPPAVIAATSTVAAQTAEAAYATAVARSASTPNVATYVAPFTPGPMTPPAPTATVAVAPTPVNAPATQTVAAQTAEAGIMAVETSVSGNTPTPVPSIAPLVTPTPPLPTLLPNTGRGNGMEWQIRAVLAGILAIAVGIGLRRRPVLRSRRDPSDACADL